MYTRFKKLVSVFVALTMALGLAAWTSAEAKAAAAYIIDGTSGHTWNDIAPGGEITLNDGDTLDIRAGAGDPAYATVIHIAANANVAINGSVTDDPESGTSITQVNNLSITEDAGDTVTHTVTIQNLWVSPWSGPAYRQYIGVINLVGQVVFDNSDTDAFVAAAGVASFTSSSNGSVNISAYTELAYNVAGIRARSLNIMGNAVVGAVGIYTEAAVVSSNISIAKDAGLYAYGFESPSIQSEGDLIITNYGNLEAGSGGFDGKAVSCSGAMDIRVAAGSKTTLTNSSGSVETDSFSMIPESGYEWVVSGAAFASGGVFSPVMSINISNGGIATVRLAHGTGNPIVEILPGGGGAAGQYVFLDQAFANIAGNTPTTVRLLDDAYSDFGCYLSDKNITFDLNGHNLIFENPEGDALNLYNCNIDYINQGEGSFQVISKTGNGLYITGGSCALTYAETDADEIVTYDPENDNYYMQSFSAIECAGASVTVNGDVIGTGKTCCGIDAFNYPKYYSSITVNGNIQMTGYASDAVLCMNGKVDIIGDIASTGYGSIGLNLSAGAVASITGNIISDESGILAYDGAIVTMTGDIETVGSAADALRCFNGANVTVYGNLTSKGGGISASPGYGSSSDLPPTVSVFGNVTAKDGDGIYAFGNGTIVKVSGNVEAGDLLSGEEILDLGANCQDGAAVYVDGDITAISDLAYGVYCNGGNSSVDVTGDITSEDGTGVAVNNGATVTEDGVITALKYISVGDNLQYLSGVELIPADGVPDAVKPGYLKYTDGTSIVWVKHLPYAQTPVITTQPAEYTEVRAGESVILSVGAEAPDGGTLSYQWYSCDENGQDAAAIAGATDASYSFAATEAGTVYYFVTVTNILGGSTASIESNAATVVVTAADVSAVDKAELEALIAEADGLLAGTSLDGSTAASVKALQDALAAAKAVDADGAATQNDVNAARDALKAAILGASSSQASLLCAVKSMAAKIGKPLQIPFTWDGAGKVTITTSNAAVCNVTQDGALIPMKVGVAVITITPPGNGAKVVFAVTVTA